MGFYCTVMVGRKCEQCGLIERVDCQFKTGDEVWALPKAEAGGKIDCPDMCPPGVYYGLADRLCAVCLPSYDERMRLMRQEGWDQLCYWRVTVSEDYTVSAALDPEWREP